MSWKHFPDRLICALLFGLMAVLGLGLLFFMENQSFEAQALRLWERVKGERLSFTAGLLEESSNRETPVFALKNQLVELLIQDCSQRIREDFQGRLKQGLSPTEALKLSVDEAPRPFGHLMQLSVGIRGRLLGVFGQSLDGFDTHWSKDLMRLVRKMEKGETIPQEDSIAITSPVFGLPLEPEELKSRLKHLVQIHSPVSQKDFYLLMDGLDLLDEKGAIQLWFTVDAHEIGIQDLKTGIRDLLSFRDLRIQPSIQDALIVDGRVFLLGETRVDGISLYLKRPFMDWFWPVSGSILILAFCLGFLLGYARLQKFFGLRFLLLLVLFWGLSLLLSRALMLNSQKQELVLRDSLSRKQGEQVLEALEDGYHKKIENMENALQEWKAARDPLSMEIIRKNRLRVVVVDKNCRYRSRAPKGIYNQGDFAFNISLIAIPIMITYLSPPGCGQIEGSFAQRAFQYDRPGQGLGTIRERGAAYGDVMVWNVPSLNQVADEVLPHLMQNRRDRFFSITFGPEKVLFLGSLEQEGEDFRFLSVAIHSDEWMESFLREQSAQEAGFKAYLRESGKTAGISEQFTVSDFENLYQQADARGLVQEQGRTWLATKSPIFPRWRFLIPLESQVVNHQFSQAWAMAIFLAFLLMLVASYLFLGQILNPLKTVKEGFSQVEADELDFELPVAGQTEPSQVLSQFNTMLEGLREKRAMRPFVSEAVSHLFAKFRSGEQAICGQATVVFSDLRDFTTMSEMHDPADIVAMLNDYFSLWQPIVERHHGVIIRFIGDAVYAIFLQELVEDYRYHALMSGVEIMQEVARFNERRVQKGLFTIENGIGVASGEVHFTIIGGEEKQEFLILGKAAELAEELEAESKRGVATRIIIDQETWLGGGRHFEYLPFESEVATDQKVWEIA